MYFPCSSYQAESHNLAGVSIWSENGPEYHWLQVLRHNWFVWELSGVHDGYLLAAMFLSEEPTRSEPPNETGKHLSGRRLKHPLPAGFKYSCKRWPVQSHSTLHYNMYITDCMAEYTIICISIHTGDGRGLQPKWLVGGTNCKILFCLVFVLV